MENRTQGGASAETCPRASARASPARARPAKKRAPCWQQRWNSGWKPPAHEVQLVNYLTAAGIEIELLLNFGADKLQFKRKHRTYRPKQETED